MTGIRHWMLGAALLVTAGPVWADMPASDATSTGNATAPIQVDRSANPCNNFFEYVCRPWINGNPIPADQSRWGRFDVLAIHNREALRSLLDDAIQHPKPESQKVANFYASCMDEASINQKGLAPLTAELDQINAIQNKTQLPALIAHLHSIGVNSLFSFGSEPDNQDTTIEIAGIDQGGLGLPDRDYYLKTDPKSVEQRTAYQAHIAKMLVLAGDADATAQQEAASILAFETQLAQGAMTRVERRDPVAVYHKLPVDELGKSVASFDWSVYFTDIGAPSFTSLNIHEPKFVETLGKTLDSASLDDIKSYLRWHLIHRSAPLLSTPFVDENFAFYGKVLSGSKELQPRWRRCVVNTDDSMGEALGKLYVDTYFPASAKGRIEELIQGLRDAFAQDLAHISWMEKKTRATALAKLAAMAEKIGYPDKWRDYSSLDIQPDDALGNSFRASIFETRRDSAKIGQPVDRSEWDMTPPTVNAYYDPQNNDINFPAGILQPPFFGSDDDATNYGAIGVVIGHEMTHGFDDEGRQFGIHGNLENWWSSKDEARFKEKSACLVKEYGNFTAIDDVKVNGALTLGENTADNGGIRLALAAFKKHLQAHPETTIDGLTPMQRFFVGFAQVWCSDIRPEAARLHALTDPHSPAQFRVNGVVSNVPAFQQAFHCAPQSAMVPAQRCQVW